MPVTWIRGAQVVAVPLALSRPSISSSINLVFSLVKTIFLKSFQTYIFIGQEENIHSHCGGYLFYLFHFPFCKNFCILTGYNHNFNQQLYGFEVWKQANLRCRIRIFNSGLILFGGH